MHGSDILLYARRVGQVRTQSVLLAGRGVKRVALRRRARGEPGLLRVRLNVRPLGSDKCLRACVTSAKTRLRSERGFCARGDGGPLLS